MRKQIPIHNLYYLCCYAWGYFKEGQALAVGTTESPEIVNLFATVLINGVRRLIRRGLDRGYVVVEEDLKSIRGRVALSSSLKRMLLENGKAHCVFDELSHDVLHNRIIRATIACLKRADNLEPPLLRQLQEIDRYLSNVTLVKLHKNDFRRVQLHRNNSFYDLLLKICELIYDCLLPTEAAGRSKFQDISKDEIRMSSLFEEFVRKFYYFEQKHYRVRRTNIDWLVSDTSADDMTYLPIMKTDICLEASDHTIIMDTKFYTKTFVENYDGRRIKSSDLYQLYAYMRNTASKLPIGKHLSGVLLYPTVDADAFLSYTLAGHKVRVATVDLSRSWQDIRDRLIFLLNEMHADLV